MIIVYGLFIYSIYEFLKFLFLATLGDIITTIKGNYDSPERDRAIKRDLWTVAKSIIAFIIACNIILNFKSSFWILLVIFRSYFSYSFQNIMKKYQLFN